MSIECVGGGTPVFAALSLEINFHLCFALAEWIAIGSGAKLYFGFGFQKTKKTSMPNAGIFSEITQINYDLKIYFESVFCVFTFMINCKNKIVDVMKLYH